MSISKIDELLMLSNHWYEVDDQTFMAYEDDGQVERVVDAAFLAKEHPMLPDAIRGLIEWARQEQQKDWAKYSAMQKLSMNYEEHGSAEATLVAHTYDLLTKGGFEFESSTGMPYLVLSAIDILWNSETSEQHELIGLVGFVEKIKVGDNEVPIVVRAQYKRFFVTKAYLNEHYSGWDTRLKIGDELGVERDELMYQVFPRRVQKDALYVSDVSAITFE